MSVDVRFFRAINPAPGLLPALFLYNGGNADSTAKAGKTGSDGSLKTRRSGSILEGSTRNSEKKEK